MDLNLKGLVGDITGLGSAANFAKGIVDRIWPPDADPNTKMEKQAEIEQAIIARDQTLDEVKGRVIQAELQQGDKFTKRARPSIIYAGLVFIGLAYLIIPFFVWIITVALTLLVDNPEKLIELLTPPAIYLPEPFWTAWGGVASLWVVGRSWERKGGGNWLTKIVTGNKPNLKEM